MARCKAGHDDKNNHHQNLHEVFLPWPVNYTLNKDGSINDNIDSQTLDISISQPKGTQKYYMERNRYMQDIMDKATTPWSVKIHIDQINRVDLGRLFNTMDREDVCTILLYREDTFKSFLSRLIAEHTNIWQSNDMNENSKHDTEIYSIENAAYGTMMDTIAQSVELLNFYKSYPSWNHIMKYEDLTGDLYSDFYHIFGYVDPEFIENQMAFSLIPGRMTTDSDKKRIVSNYNQIHDEYIKYVNRHSFSENLIID
jgi:hypothetical protein